jgi:hypothetical protein
MVKIGTVLTGKFTHRLELASGDVRETQIIKTHGKTKTLENGLELTVGLRGKAVIAQTLL